MGTDFTGKVAVVLGASSARGTGWAIAEALAAQGAKVVVGARTLAPLQELAKKTGGIAVRCDATSEDDIKLLIATALKEYGQLDIAVNAAGSALMGPIETAETATLQSSLDTNYLANVYFVKHAAAAMGNGGSIVIISTMATTNVMGPLFPYACAKAATDCLVRYAAVEYGGRNIRVNSVQPGPILSDLTWDLLTNPQVKERMEYEIPLKRIGVPSDFANAVLWLAGPCYATGINLQLNGGHFLQRFPRPEELAAKVEDAGRPQHDREQGAT